MLPTISEITKNSPTANPCEFAVVIVVVAPTAMLVIFTTPRENISTFLVNIGSC